MTPPESPASLLERAAQRLEQLAKDATLPVWSAHDLASHGHNGVWWVEANWEAEDHYGSQCVAELETVNPKADAAWIATMSPAVAAPLAKWLRGDAHYCERFMQRDWPGLEAWSSMTVARLILGEPVPGEDGE